ncbi:5-methyltetrahydropteroyltriglutamate--homocysteine S-methyltransferase [Frateuria aurantia]
MTSTTYLGFPRIGRRRELKHALEAYWRDPSQQAALLATAAGLRQRHWQLARDCGIEVVPVNDFSLYDHVLDHAVLFDVIPPRHRAGFERDPLAGYFAMARGSSDGHALEMTKWFDTNYHYLVPELQAGQSFRLRSDKVLQEWREAGAAGHRGRPVVLGPVSFLALSKTVDGSDPLTLLPALLPVYAQLLQQLAEAGVEWVQLDEPILVTDLNPALTQAYRQAYAHLAHGLSPRRMLATYFGACDLELAISLPVDGIHVDLARAPEQLEPLLARLPSDRVLSAGIIDGRGIWRSQPVRVQALLQTLAARCRPGQLWLAPSCSLLHLPYDAEQEQELALDVQPWLAFARQKLEELSYYSGSMRGEPLAIEALRAQRDVLAARPDTAGVQRAEVRRRVAALSPQAALRRSDASHRRVVQAESLPLPLLPTTTIGSFPQTAALRQARARHRRGQLDDADYQAVLREEIERVIRFQEQIGLDVLVHGEAERNDMVEYFGERLEGFAFTRHGWVQSYGSRCVKPPIIWGDIDRPAPMTVAWAEYAQSLTSRPVKGMLTGPLTLLQWSFVRDDLERSEICLQLALALRDEVQDLQKAGIRLIQIDEPALREGLPLRAAEQSAYLQWAVHGFRVTAGGAQDRTQIHTHMCYSQFNEIMAAVAALDADVISIESSRSRMELLDAFRDFDYPAAIGPGIYDIHSPRIPSTEEMAGLLQRALQVLRPGQLWVNPDCGLKTRDWEQLRPALQHMVEAAHQLRSTLAQP